jgi:2-oxoisovalerate dehydrogenase E1 component alpha subunit
LNSYPGEKSQFTSKLQLDVSEQILPTYRIMDENGNIIDKEQVPQLEKETILKMFRSMLTLSVMDNILNDVQRQGRISFYMKSEGEEAIHFGSAAALDMKDVIFGQYRETGVFMWRGFSLEDFMNQCYSNRLDYGKGRQMPVHYGAKHLNFQTISSPLATQISQAAGSAYAQKLMGSKNCTVCYFGEGAASEGDFHAAMNFSSTLKCPTIFFCRNNHYAISTPSTEQYSGDGIAGRAAGYGMAAIRVDGNDIFALYNATKLARKTAIDEQKPVLIEAMTYRLGHHSTSDDSSRYRTTSEVETWKQNFHPIPRLRNYLLIRNWWTEIEEKNFLKEARKNVLESLKRAEQEKKPPISDLFTDVYDTIPQHLQQQQIELYNHLSKYPESYPTTLYEESKDNTF